MKIFTKFTRRLINNTQAKRVIFSTVDHNIGVGYSENEEALTKEELVETLFKHFSGKQSKSKIAKLVDQAYKIEEASLVGKTKDIYHELGRLCRRKELLVKINSFLLGLNL